jgi:phenylpropionate dioxygenase-like ring-hydroxylating dioxygenase large terminal subunit
MFRGFANVWTPLLLSRAVGRKPALVTLAGESLVLFRDAAGRVAALADRCPHRGAALSQGRVTADGHIECPFHGWQFDGTGRNCHVPLNPDAKRDQLSATALPVREIGDMIWLFTAPGTEAPFAPQVPDGLAAPGLSRTYVQRSWRCHWTRAMENMLDSTHLPFVHRRSIGKALRQRMTPQSRLEIAWEETPFGGRAEARMDGTPGGAFLEYWKPNIMALHIPVPGKHLRIHALAIPEADGVTRLVVCQSRGFARSPLLNPVFAWTNRRIADEDKAVVESGGPEEVPPAASEHSVATDRVTLQFRKYYYDELRPSRA